MSPRKWPSTLSWPQSRRKTWPRCTPTLRVGGRSKPPWGCASRLLPRSCTATFTGTRVVTEPGLVSTNAGDAGFGGNVEFRIYSRSGRRVAAVQRFARSLLRGIAMNEVVFIALPGGQLMKGRWLGGAVQIRAPHRCLGRVRLLAGMQASLRNC